MHIIAEMDVWPIHFKPVWADDFQPAADTVKLRCDTPICVKAATEINQQANAVWLIVTTQWVRPYRLGCAHPI